MTQNIIIDYDPTSKFQDTTNKKLKYLLKHEQKEEIFKFLLQENPRPGKFYMLMKVLKPNHPGRPIISEIGTSTEYICI